MKFTIDTEARMLSIATGSEVKTIPLYSNEAFELLSDQWVKVGWNQKHPYTFTWFGRPLIQLPEDVLRVQEVFWRVKPDVVIETGVAHGGSVVFYASLCQAIGRGRVIGIDIEIRPHNRKAIEAHPMAQRITLIEGSSTAPDVVNQVKNLVGPGETCLAILDSCHTRAHVRDELDAYHALVTSGSYIVATDGVMEQVHDVPRGLTEWRDDNPSTAAREFAAAHPEFVLEQPEWLFNESELSKNITHWPAAYLRRR